MGEGRSAVIETFTSVAPYFSQNSVYNLLQQRVHFAARCMSVIKYMNSIACCSELNIYNL